MTFQKNTTVKVGIVGLGVVSDSHHIKGYQSHPGAEVVAVCDLDEQRAQAGLPEIRHQKTLYRLLSRRLNNSSLITKHSC